MGIERQSDNPLKDKIAVVTGGSRGIGFALAERLLREGAKVAFCGTKQPNIDAAVRSLSPLGPVVGMVADVSNLQEVKRFFGAVQLSYNHIDILINNAGGAVYQAT